MSDNLPTRFFRSEVLSMSAYKVIEAENMVKLDAMENPYPWPEAIQQQWLQTLKNCAVNRYPDPQAKTLTAVLRDSNRIPQQSAILLGNGSDEIIQILLMSLPADSCVLAPEPGFVMYRQVARSLGLDYRDVPLLPGNFELDLSAMLAAIDEFRPKLIFLAYPNNPTGNLFDAQSIKTIVAAAPGLVVIDEAYAPFADASFIEHLGAYENLLVMRTVSKLGLAGLRLGFLAGHPLLIEQLDKIRLPYNINSLTQSTVVFALNHSEFLLNQTQTICRQRAQMFEALSGMDTIKTFPSAANFILFKTLAADAGRVFELLKQQGILIKNLSNHGGLLENCLRVTIGTPEENQAFLKALQYALGHCRQ